MFYDRLVKYPNGKGDEIEEHVFFAHRLLDNDTYECIEDIYYIPYRNGIKIGEEKYKYHKRYKMVTNENIEDVAARTLDKLTKRALA